MLKDHRAYATLPAADFDRAKAWYRDKLGLMPSTDTPGGAFYTLAGGAGFLLYPTQFAGTAQNTAIGFDSDDVDGDVAALKAKGVVFEEYDFPGLKTVNGIADMGGMKSAWFKDSEGNIVAVTNGVG
jgi:catechol 2,3-dioxygenase-like lactoylglutathione lyase family enzyme